MAATNSHYDGYELKVRTDEVKSVRTERVSANLTYEGRCVSINADTSLPIWQIKRIITSGNQQYIEWANEGAYTAAWDERATNAAYWPGAILLDNNFSLNFDGINDYLAFATTAFTNMDVATQWSMSFWVRFNNLATQRCIYSKTTNDANVYGYNLQVNTSGQIFAQARSASYSSNYTGSIVISAGVWTHIVVTYSGGSNANQFRYYVDAAMDSVPGSVALGASLHSGQTPCFGARGTSGFFHSGHIDEVSFWDKALTSTEVIELYGLSPSAVQQHSAADTNLIHYWRMGDGDSFPTILDQQGTTNGTMTNMTAGNIVTVVP